MDQSQISFLNGTGSVKLAFYRIGVPTDAHLAGFRYYLSLEDADIFFGFYFILEVCEFCGASSGQQFELILKSSVYRIKQVK